MEQSRIHSPHKMRQLIDFKGCSVGDGLYPTDIDGLIEYKDKGYLLFEVKYDGAQVPLGQKLALERMINDFSQKGKQSIAFICDHTVRDTHKSIVLAWCKVREIYYGGEKVWRKPEKELTVREAINDFIPVFYKSNTKEAVYG